MATAPISLEFACRNFRLAIEIHTTISAAKDGGAPDRHLNLRDPVFLGYLGFELLGEKAPELNAQLV
jgi:hypothetical protein